MTWDNQKNINLESLKTSKILFKTKKIRIIIYSTIIKKIELIEAIMIFKVINRDIKVQKSLNKAQEEMNRVIQINKILKIPT